ELSLLGCINNKRRDSGWTWVSYFLLDARVGNLRILNFMSLSLILQNEVIVFDGDIRLELCSCLEVVLVSNKGYDPLEMLGLNLCMSFRFEDSRTQSWFCGF
ncbi:hypothetical protein Pfo_002154, partial [Paulownia fortunei]